MSFKINCITHFISFIISILITIILFGFINNTLNSLIIMGLLIYPTRNILINFNLCIIVLMIPVTFFHEAIHGLMHLLFKGRVKFGFKLIYAYTQEISMRPLNRIKFQLVLLAPLFSISIIAYLINGLLGNMLFILNILGSSGDIYMAVLLFKYSEKSRIIDKSYGFDII